MKSVWKFLNTREEAIQFLLAKPKNTVTPVTYQKIANEVEMLDAFYGLLKAGDDKFRKKKAFKPFKKLARHAGEVSALQQEEFMLNQLFSKDQLGAYKRDVRRLKETKRANYFMAVNEKFVEALAVQKSALEALLRNINKKLVSEYLKKKKKKISKILNKADFKATKLDDLRSRVKEYNTLKILTEKTKPKKDAFEKLLHEWKIANDRILHLNILIESGVFAAKEANLIKKAKAKLVEDEAGLVKQIVESVSALGN